MIRFGFRRHCTGSLPKTESRGKLSILEQAPASSRLLILALAAGLLAGTAAGGSGELQSHASIRSAARDFVLANASGLQFPPTVTVGRLDSRLQLARCSEKLQAFAPPGRKTTGRTTVGVRCTGRKPWSLYVPVTISIMGKAVVATRDLVRGDFITAADVRLEQQDLTRLHSGYLGALDLAVGKRVKRTIRRGGIIKPTQIAAPTMIKKGAEVTITAKSNSILVKTKGKALSSGGPGERIRVRNLSSNKVLEATVVRAGVVQVDL